MKTKRILALVLAMLLLAGFFPTAPQTAYADGKKLITKTRKGLDLYKQALRPLYESVYPENLAAPEEAVLGLYRTMAVDLCELWK